MNTKYFDDVIRAAFDAGVEQGRSQPAATGGANGEAYRAWRRTWAGLPRDPVASSPNFQRSSEAGCYS